MPSIIDAPSPAATTALRRVRTDEERARENMSNFVMRGEPPGVSEPGSPPGWLHIGNPRPRRTQNGLSTTNGRISGINYSTLDVNY
ncbi:hypothetical protein GCM10009730_09430 [Streptomyces albidochromogenes]